MRKRSQNDKDMVNIYNLLSLILTVDLSLLYGKNKIAQSGTNHVLCADTGMPLEALGAESKHVLIISLSHPALHTAICCPERGECCRSD